MQSLYEAFAQARAQSPDLFFLALVPSAGDARWTFEQAGREVDRLARQYAARGWGTGHRVALGVGNHPRHFFHFLALNSLGASIVPMNPDHRSAELRYQFMHAGVQLVVASAERAGVAREASAGIEPQVSVIALEDFAALPPAPSHRHFSERGLRAEAAVLYTSGTSGLPKGCVLSNAYILTAGAWYRDLGAALTLRHGEERLLNPLPVFHMNCGVTSIAAMCLTHNCLMLPERFHASTWWEDCAASGATAIHYLGVMPPALVKRESSPLETAHRIRFGLGAGCEPSLHPVFEARFGFPLIEVWGMTETGRFIANHREPRSIHTRAFGRAEGALEARVAAEDGQPVPDGQTGELLVRDTGPDPRRGFFSRYLDDPRATDEAWRGGWFHTGDMVQRDASGMLYFVDRRKDMIRRSGENISAGEVEAVLASHPAVARVAVLPVADEMRDEEVLAVVETTAGCAGDADLARGLVAHCLRELAYYKAPAWVAFRADLPVTPTNKLQKHRIFAKGEDPRVGAIDLRSLKKRPLHHAS